MAPQTQALFQARPPTLPSTAEIPGVPFFPQSRYQCGPATLAMSLNWAGVTVTPDQLVPEVYIPEKKGALQVEMLAAARRHGTLAYQLAPELSHILTEISAGHPVIVFQNLGLGWYPVWHYAVVVGYDLNERYILLHTGTDRQRRVSLMQFERTWARGGYWAMLTMPPDQLPQTATEMRFLQAAVALEKSGRFQQAVRAYEAALLRWPGSLPAQIGRGNAYYALGDIRKAEQAFYQATLDHPGSAAAFNNLAQTYADQRRYREALAAAKSAVRLDAASAVYQQTLKEIRILIGNTSVTR
ncbi:MAG: PA2778 family cysteine peptidase [Mariprofundaceae bacterium]|nr:PA2778 family cysteine peptidase [Mariprofundaceae bacterium]